MPRNETSLPEYVAGRLRRTADRIAPPQTLEDQLAAYAQDPIGFAQDVLGLQLWSRQREIVGSVLEHERVAVISGRKVGKSASCAALALWFYCTQPQGRVILMAPIARQITDIIWREIRIRVQQARVKIPGELHLSPQGGLINHSTFAEIKGYTARDKEAIAGISGKRILYVIDEASGVPQQIFDAIEGNRAGGKAWVFLISNPTRGEGEFYDAFHSKSKKEIGAPGYHNIHIDSRESPNITGEFSEQVEGLATSAWIDARKIDWGEQSAQWKVHIEGSFAVAEEGKIIPLSVVEAAKERWDETLAEGPLCIGVDPAGEGGQGDESGFTARRGKKILEVRLRTGLTPADHVATIQDMIAAAELPRGTPKPIVIVDSEGAEGARVWAAIKEHAEGPTPSFWARRVRAGDNARRQPNTYVMVRDELYASGAEWLREGGAIPSHTKLERDLNAPMWEGTLRNKIRATPKLELREMLGRSPDAGDSFLLACWVPGDLRDTLGSGKAAAAADDGPVQGVRVGRLGDAQYEGIGEPLHDPYASAFDPYRS